VLRVPAGCELEPVGVPESKLGVN